MSLEPIDPSEIRRTLTSLQTLVDHLPCRLAVFSDEAAAARSPNDGWSKKQELGHLIDSASNNHQRIARAQIENHLALPGYDGDRWVDVHGYHQRDWTDLIQLWQLFNIQLLAAARSVPDKSWSHTLTVGDSEPMTLGFVTVDYVKHMAQHLRHIGVDVDELLKKSARNDRPYPEKTAPVAQKINDLMTRRWSSRAFASHEVEREKILKLLEAARWAPSCYNDQPKYFLVFDGSDQGALEKARACLVPGNSWAAKAPVLLLSVARESFEQNGKPNRWAQHDVGLATENLLLEAVAIGLMAHPMAGFDAERAREEFAIPDGFTPMAMIAIGYLYQGPLDLLDEKVQKGELAQRERKLVSEFAFAGTWGTSYR